MIYYFFYILFILNTKLSNFFITFWYCSSTFVVTNKLTLLNVTWFITNSHWLSFNISFTLSFTKSSEFSIKNCKTLLAFFAKRYIRKHKPYIIWINWSVGKTSCRMIIYQTLKQFFPHLKISTSKKNFNGELGLSLSIFEIDEWNPTVGTFISVLRKVIRKTVFGPKRYDIIILEYGIDRPKEMEFLIHIAKPHIWVFTAIDSVHSEQFGNPAEIAKEEVKMIQNTLEMWFLNANDIYAIQLKDMIKIDYLMYQTQWYDIPADITFDKEKFFLWDIQWHLWVSFDLHIKKNVHHIQTNILGKANYGYVWVALTIAEIISWKPKFAEHKLH